jgi:2-hydroxychromene-2-carboxylate isomerase
MTIAYDLFWSFRSPYSYLAVPRLIELERDYDVRATVRPVYPIAVRIDGFFKNANPMWLPYLVRDVARMAEMLGMPFAPPNPDPIEMDNKTGQVPKEQPYIGRLTRLGVAVIWGGTANWHQGDHLARASERAGLDLAELDSDIAADAGRYEAVIVENEAAQKKAGHWGVPLMVLDGEPFFGQDRIEVLKWRMATKGLTRRPA